MKLEEPELQIAKAREVVLRWLQSRKPGWYETNAALATEFVRCIAADTNLEIRTVYNPSACVFEARWYHGGRETEEFRKPFSAEAEPDARILACAAMVRLQ